MDYIRKFIVDTDMETVMRIWHEGNLEAHDFVDPSYWDKSRSYVRRTLGEVDVYVYESDGRIVGFMGIDGSYLAGLFVQRDFRGRGFGTRMLEWIKDENDYFTLHVFKKNYAAIEFYQNRGLSIRDLEVNEDLGEEEYLMYYRRVKEEQ